MKYQSILKWLIPPIYLLTLFAASMGLFYKTPGEPYQFTSHRGETVMLNGHGLYFYDTVSSTAQMQANDLITLVIGLPLLVIATRMAFRGSLRGRLLLTGTLGFILYTYMSMSTLTSFNALFVVYIILFTLSMYAFILSMMSFDLNDLPNHFSGKLPRGWIAGLMFIIAGFFALAWLGRIFAALQEGAIPALENTTTMVIQFMDLGLIAPAAVLGGILILRRSAWGYLLAAIMMTKGITLGLAVSTMAINMSLKGVPEGFGIMIPFLVITAANLVMTVVMLKNVKE